MVEKPETETVPIVVNLPANIAAFLDRLAALHGLNNAADYVRFTVLQDVKDAAETAEIHLQDALEYFNINIDELPGDATEYRTKSFTPQPTDNGSVKVHITEEA